MDGSLARGHHGGGLDEMNVTFSYRYPERIRLVAIDQRVVHGGETFDVGEATVRSDGPDGTGLTS